MKHLKKFTRDFKKEDPKKISKIIFDYFEEYDSDAGDHFWDMMDILMESYYPGEPEFSDYLSYNEILLSVSNILSGDKNKYLGDNIYNMFINKYLEIEKIMLSSDFLKQEEIEDYFLDINYKYKIRRSSKTEKKSNFVIDIMDIDSKDIVSLFNRIWTVINNRLPKKYFVNDIFVLKESNIKNSIRVTISNTFKNINTSDLPDDFDFQ